MQFKKFVRNNKEHIINYSVLLIGILACCFCRLTFNMFFCAFIFPGCFLYFSRKTKAYIGLPLIFAGCVIGCGIALWGFIMAGGVGMQILLAFLCGLIIWIPYLLDKLIYVRFFAKHSFILTFLFPLTWITIDVIMGLTPIANYISIGYVLSQIIQTASIVSLFGLNFVAFMIIYFNSAIASFAIDTKHNKKAVITALSICGFSLVYSGIYNAVPVSYSNNIRIMTGYSTNDKPSDDRSKFDLDFNQEWVTIDIAKAKVENAQILMYPEEAFWIYSGSEEDSFKSFLKQQSINNNIYIVSGIEMSDKDDTNKLSKNLAWVTTPSGQLIEYQKTHLVPLDEEGFEAGNGDPITFDVNGSKIGLVICMDLEFPTFVSKIGRLGCDILLAPSWDWPSMPSNHSICDAYRAVENGVNFVRCTEAGHSIATDYKGNVIAHYYNDYNFEQKQHNNHVFNLPAKGVTTVYCWLAPAIDYFYIAGLATLITYCVIIDHKKSKQKPIKK